MSDANNNQDIGDNPNAASANNADNGDGAADAIAATAVIALVVVTLAIWLSGMPS